MKQEVDIDSMSLVVQELGIKVYTYYYRKDNETHAEIRKHDNYFEIWFAAEISNMGSKYLENYARIEVSKEQLIALRDLINFKLKM